MNDDCDWDTVVSLSGELIAAVERALDGIGLKFKPAFDSVRLELADDFRFLDPISDGFKYENGTLTAVEVPRTSFISGLSEALRRLVNNAASGDRARRIRERVALELFSAAASVPNQ